MLTFFANPEVTLGNKLLEILFIIMGLISIYCAVRNMRDKGNAAPVGTAIFWGALGIVMALGRWLPPIVSGVLVIVMTVPAILRKVKVGSSKAPDPEYTREQANKIGMKIFIPALSIGIMAILFVLFTTLGALVGIGAGVIVSIVALMAFNKDNKPGVFLDDSRRLLDVVGPLCMLPMLLAALGAVFTNAGVGEIVAELVGRVVPQGNVTMGIVVLGVGMALFTMIMGNAFAAITVMIAGIGQPFVLAYGADPVLIGALALTCGYCGTLMTPMAANFNIVPVAMLDMKDKYGVIKNQVPVALFMLVFQIVYMIIFK